MRWGDLRESGGPAGGGQTLRERQAVLWAQPQAPPIPAPDSQARTVTALHTQSRGSHLPPVGTARGLLCVWGLHAGGFGETGPGQGQHLPGPESCPGLPQGRPWSPHQAQISPWPTLPPAPSLALWAIRALCTAAVQSLPLPSPPARWIPTVRNQGGYQPISGRKEQQTAQHFPNKAEAGTAAAGVTLRARASGSAGKSPEKCRFSVKCILAELNAFCSFTG